MKYGWLITLFLFFSFSASAAEEELTLVADWGALRGTLWSPETGSDMVVILVAGSGPTDRYGNSPSGVRTQAYVLLAEAISEAGYAAFSYDKRGIGASYYHQREQLLTDCHFTYYADDLERWVEYLLKRGYRRIVLMGHSEGALLAQIVATRNDKVTGLISLCGAAYPIDQILKQQLAAQLLAVDYGLYATACRLVDTLKRGDVPEQVPATLASLFPTYLNDYYREWMSYDPCALARATSCPMLIVGGGRDLQLSLANARALKGACPAAGLVLLEQMGHTLKDTEGKTSQEQLEAYTNPQLPLAEGLKEALIDFLGRI